MSQRNPPNPPAKRPPCPACGGSGQTGSFYGVSRFLLTWEECALCGGTGVDLAEDPVTIPDTLAKQNRPTGDGEQ